MKLNRSDHRDRYTQTVLSDPGLVSYWPLNERVGTRANEPHLGLVGTYTGGYTLATAPQAVANVPGGVLLNGSTGYVTVAHNAALNLGNGPFSVEFWYRLTTASQTTRWFVSKGTQFGCLIGSDGKFNMDNFSAFNTKSSGAINGDTNWHHLIVSYNGTTTGRVYWDGADASGATATAACSNSAGALTVGCENDLAGFISGTLAHVAVYNRLLTLPDARHHYALGLGL